MAAVVLSQNVVYDQLNANGLITGGGGVVSRGGVLVQSQGGVLVAPEQAQNAEIRISASGDGTTGNNATMIWTEKSAALTEIGYGIALGTGGAGGALAEGILQLNAYVNNASVQELFRVAPNPRGEAGPPIIPANSALFNLVSPVQSGVATIPLGAATVSVALTSITANAVVVVTGKGAHDTTALAFNVTITAGTGFAITSNANATAAKDVMWFVVHI
jgi:hypothetical protein